MIKPFVIGVSGGSGSGKTTFSNRFMSVVGENKCEILGQDSYYLDQSHLFDEDGGQINFDHPESLDFELMEHHLRLLKEGKSVEVPLYDFASHKRLPETIPLNPCEIIILDGILILSQEKIRQMMDLSIFIDIHEDVRFMRRLMRDTKERGRTEEGVRKQFHQQVRPMHEQFVAPSSNHADYIFKDNKQSEEFIPVLINRLKAEFAIEI